MECFSQCIKEKLKIDEEKHACFLEYFPKANGDCVEECDNDKGTVMNCKKCLRSPECDVPWNMCLHFTPKEEEEKSPFE